MDSSYLNYVLTEDERHRFETDGYLIIEDAIPPGLLRHGEANIGHQPDSQAAL